MDEVTVSRARALWEELAGGRFPQRGQVRVVETTTSRLCPPGWAGIITLAGAVLATAPTAAQAALLEAALLKAASPEAAPPEAAPPKGPPPEAAPPESPPPEAAPPESPPPEAAPPESPPPESPPPEGAPPEAGRTGAPAPEAAPLDIGSLQVQDTLGPAALAYLAPTDFQSYGDERPQDPERPAPGVEWAGPAELADLLATVDPAEAAESGLGGLPRAAVIRVGGRIVAAAGYERWPAGTAHLCVLTATAHRGRGHATRLAAVATADALAAGLLPQWRARVLASRRVADKLGYRVLGEQRSLLLTA